MISINTLGVLMTIFIATFVAVNADERDGFRRPTSRLSERACEGDTLNIRCNRGVINIINANYGRTSRRECNKNGNAPIRNVNCSSRNSLNVVKERCSNKDSCSVHASDRVFGGDPCDGTYKYLEVEYQCIQAPSSQAKRAVACQNSKLELECERGEEIRVLEANYGRTDRRTCNHHGNAPIQSTDCRSRRSDDIVRENCAGKRQCIVSASNDVFGEPCFGTLKYLEVEYLCIRRRN